MIETCDKCGNDMPCKCNKYSKENLQIMNQYLKAVGKHSIPSREKELELANGFKKDAPSVQTKASELDPVELESRSDLVRRNLRLVVSIAKHYSNRGMDLEDLIQEGNIGLLKAADKYDPSRGFKFGTYACVPLSTMIWTKRGWVSHTDLRPTDETIGYNLKNTYAEWTPIIGHEVFEPAPLVEISFPGGWPLTCTLEHKWVVYDGSGNRKLVTTDNLMTFRDRGELILSACMRNNDTWLGTFLPGMNSPLGSIPIKNLMFRDIEPQKVWCPKTGLGTWLALEHGQSFFTGNTYWIKQSITRAIADHSRLIRIPVHITELTSRIATAYKALLATQNTVTPQDIATALDLNPVKVYLLMSISQTPASLHSKVDDTDICLGDIISDNGEQDFGDPLLVESMKTYLETLPDRERDILYLRYGLCGTKEHTLEEIATVMGVTRERARQIEIRALRRIRSSGLAKKTLVKGQGKAI